MKSLTYIYVRIVILYTPKPIIERSTVLKKCKSTIYNVRVLHVTHTDFKPAIQD